MYHGVTTVSKARRNRRNRVDRYTEMWQWFANNNHQFSPAEDATISVKHIATFWTWFTANQGRLIDDSDLDASMKVDDEFEAQITQIHPSLVGWWDVVDGRPALVIGGTELSSTPLVFHTVIAAPVLSGWDVYAFGLPSWINEGHRHQEALLPVEDSWCTVSLAGNYLSLSIYCGETWQEADALVEYAKLMLEILYGKEWLERNFQRFSYGPNPAEPIREGVFPLDLLTAALDNLKLILRDWEVQDSQTTFQIGSRKFSLGAITRP